jgi:cadmium resistance transport/sequestration family protein
MQGLARTIVEAAALFAVTNVDGLIVLTALFMTSVRGRPRPWQIITGQYIGFVVMLTLSVMAALGLRVVPDDWIGLVGLLPLTLGVRQLLKARAGGDGGSSLLDGHLPSVVLVILANGADNISVYTPLFRTLNTAMTAVTVAVFLALVAAWCALAWFLAANKKAVTVLERAGRWFVPLVFVAIGAGVLVRTGVLARLVSAL